MTISTLPPITTEDYEIYEVIIGWFVEIVVYIMTFL